MSKVLITGGNSFTGHHLLPILHAAKLTTHSLVQTNNRPNAQTHKVDITDYEELQSAINKIQPEYIIHLAGISFAAHPRPLELYKVNLIGTENLLRAVHTVAPNIQKVILASSANIYGTCESNHINENTCPSPVNHYAASKLAMEHMAKTWMNKLPITIVRPFNYIGPGQDKKFLVPKVVNHFVDKEPVIELGNTQISRDFTDVRVICQYYMKLLTAKNATGEIVNLCSGRLISLQQILEEMKAISGQSINVQVNPDFVRKTDIMKLRGNPNKLYSLIGPQEHPSIKETLAWMFKQGILATK